MIKSLLGLAVCLALAASGSPPGGTCARCRCEKPCTKVARLVCEEKEVEVTCWGCRCEPFALPGPSRPGCEHSVEVCPSCPEEVQAGQASKDGVCSQPRKFLWRDWIPNPQATVFTKKKLLKRVVKQKVPSYRWVVEDLCAPCASAEPPTTPGPAPAAGSILEPRSAAGPRNPFSDELR